MGERTALTFEAQKKILSRRLTIEALTEAHLPLVQKFKIVASPMYQQLKQRLGHNRYYEHDAYYKSILNECLCRYITEESESGKEELANRIGFCLNEMIIIPDSLEYYIKKMPYLRRAENGKLILKERWAAFEDQQNGKRNVFLVIDHQKKEDGSEENKVVFYFALSCGLVQDDDIHKLSREEDAFAEILMRTYWYAHKFKPNKDKPEEVKLYCEKLREVELYREKLLELGKKKFSEEELAKIKKIAKDRADVRDSKKSDINREDSRKALLVNETAPGVELSHFVKSADYRAPEGVDLKLGEYIFWEGIYRRLEEIQKNAALKYVYLFAAEANTNADPGNLAGDDKKAATEDDVDRTAPLVDYYRKKFGFQYETDITLYKPPYDLNCFSMSTSMKDLKKQKEDMWDHR